MEKIEILISLTVYRRNRSITQRNMDPTTPFSEKPFTIGGTTSSDEISQQERIEELERENRMLKRRCTILESNANLQDPRMKIVRKLTGADRFDEVPWKVYRVSDDVTEIDELLEKLGASDPERQHSLFLVKANSKPNTVNWITIGEKKIKLSLIPPAVRFPGVRIIIGDDCCVNPWIFSREIEALKEAGILSRELTIKELGICIKFNDRIYLSEQCPMVMPTHLRKDMINAHAISGQKSCLEVDGTISLADEMKTLEYMTAKHFLNNGYWKFSDEYKREITDDFFKSLGATRADFFEVVGIPEKHLYRDGDDWCPPSIQMICENMKYVSCSRRDFKWCSKKNLTVVYVDG